VLRFPETWTTALGKPANCPNISAWRRSVSGDLTGVFDFANPVHGAVSLPATSVTGFSTGGPLPNPVPTTNALPAQDRMTNSGSAPPVKFTIASNNYRTDGPWTYQAAAGASVEDYFNATAYQGGWYDFTGDLETGSASVSG
jgi:phospholipase C